MFRFPWGDMHSLNLGWFLQKFNELRADWATAEENITGALDAEIQRAEDALSDVFDARDAAAASATAAAGSATAAGTSATAAQNSATGAASSATLANQKATAAGLSEAAAAQSATAAGNSATAAAGSATAASNAATNAAASETAAGNSAAAAAASAASIAGDVDAADSDALKAEGFSVGQQNGIDVGPGSPYYQNNAKYYSEHVGDLSMLFPNINTNAAIWNNRAIGGAGQNLNNDRAIASDIYFPIDKLKEIIFSSNEEGAECNIALYSKEYFDHSGFGPSGEGFINRIFTFTRLTPSQILAQYPAARSFRLYAVFPNYAGDNILENYTSITINSNFDMPYNIVGNPNRSLQGSIIRQEDSSDTERE